MTDVEFKNIIAQGENYFTEFKHSLNDDFKKDIVAFANASGGRIFLGVNDDGSIPGITIDNVLLSRIQTYTYDCEPSIMISTETVGENVFLVTIYEGVNKPYRCSDGCYIRVNANTQIFNTNTAPEINHKGGQINNSSNHKKDKPKGGQKITERQAEVLLLIKENKHITRKELCKTLGINPSAVQKHIENLKAKGFLVRKGGDKGGHWITKKK